MKWINGIIPSWKANSDCYTGFAFCSLLKRTDVVKIQTCIFSLRIRLEAISQPPPLSYLALNYNETPLDMRYILSLSLILICSTFDSLSQVESTTMRLPDRSSSQCCIPTVIQSTGNFDKDVTIGYAQGSLDITDPEIDGLAVSPNPTKGHLSVSVPADYIGLEILIVDMTGRFVGNPIPIVGTTESFTIEGESGMYLLMIKTQDRVITERIQLNTY